MIRRFRRRDFINFGLGVLAGGIAGFLISPRKFSKEKPKFPIIPMFRIHIYSNDWISENPSKVEDENMSYTEFSYQTNSVFSLDVYRDGKLVNGLEGCLPNSGWMELSDSQEKGNIKYSFVCRNKHKKETRLNISINFYNNLELLTNIFSARYKAGENVYFLDMDEDGFPRRCLVLANGSIDYKVPIHYWINGIEALASISKKELLMYWNNPEKYGSFEAFMRMHGFELKI